MVPQSAEATDQIVDGERIDLSDNDLSSQASFGFMYRDMAIASIFVRQAVQKHPGFFSHASERVQNERCEIHLLLIAFEQVLRFLGGFHAIEVPIAMGYIHTQLAVEVPVGN